MFSKLSLKARLLVLSGSMALALLLVGALGSYTMYKVTGAYEHVVNINFANFRYMAAMRFNATDFARNYLRLLIPGITPENVAKIKSDMNENIEAFEAANKEYREVPFGEGELELYTPQYELWTNFKKKGIEFADLYGSKNVEDFNRYQEMVSKELPKLRQAHADSLGLLMAYHTKASEEWVARAEDSARVGNIFAWAITITFFVLAGICGWMISTRLSSTLRDIAGRIAGGASEVASASQQVSASSEELSSAATEQAASLQETSASVEEMSAMITLSAENALQSQKISNSSQITAEKGKTAALNMLRSMEDINQSNNEIMQQIDESNRNISEIVKVIGEIGNKTKVINDIVFQTKLLSFNASVEAARAGENGKGFAVVAEEVGNLAQMSGNAAKEISEMLDGSIKKVESIVQTTKEKVEHLVRNGREKVTNGTEVAKQCSETLEEIVEGITSVSSMVSQIATSAQEQATGVSQINQAMGQIDQATQQNSAASQQTTVAAGQLSTQAEILRSIVHELMSTIDGANTQITEKQAKAPKKERSQNKKVTQLHATPINKHSKQKFQDVSADKIPSGDDSRFGT